MAKIQFISNPLYSIQCIKIVRMQRVRYNLWSSILLYSSWILKWLGCWSANHAEPPRVTLKEIRATVQEYKLSNYLHFWFLRGDKTSVSDSRTEHWTWYFTSTNLHWCKFKLMIIYLALLKSPCVRIFLIWWWMNFKCLWWENIDSFLYYKIINQTKYYKELLKIFDINREKSTSILKKKSSWREQISRYSMSLFVVLHLILILYMLFISKLVFKQTLHNIYNILTSHLTSYKHYITKLLHYT